MSCHAPAFPRTNRETSTFPDEGARGMAGSRVGVLLRHIRSLLEARGSEAAPDAALLERFARQGDEAALDALLRRHAGLVWGVCRRILGHEQDAEDVFQATFLVLARKAGSVRKRQAVGSFLYGVAYRLALRARAGPGRRGRRGGPGGPAAARPPRAPAPRGA